jgi:hypothetical protein
MPVAPIPQDRLAVLQRELDAMAAAQGVRSVKRTPTPIKNGDMARSLSMSTRLYFRGRPFDVPAVPWADGVRILERQYDLAMCGQAMEGADGLSDDQMREVLERMLAAYQELAAIFHRNVRPVTRRDRWLWRWLSNPFWNATPQEMGEVLDFFFECLTKSGVAVGGLVRHKR